MKHKGPKHITKNIDELIPYARNSRTHSDEQVAQIAASIKEFGWTNPVLIDEAGMIIAGHGRVLGARKLGETEIPCIELSHLSEAQKKAYIIADNKLALNAGWDDEMLRIEIGELQDLDFDISLMGFDDAELGLLFPEEKEGLTDEDETPEPPADPHTVLGDVWILGNHRLMCGDSENSVAIDELLDGCVPNAVITDPPYGIGIDGQKLSRSKNPKQNRKHHDFMGWDASRPDEGIFRRIVALGVPSVIWGGNYFADLLPPSRGWLYWSKGQDGLTMSDGELAWTTENKPLRSKTVNRAALQGSIHPTQKPVQVIQFSADYLQVPQKGAVMDLFSGSGTICIACEKTDRRAYMMEREPKYCDVIVKRWQNFTGQKAIHEETGEPFPSDSED